MNIETEKLKTINNYAKVQDVTRSYIYRMIREKRMQPVIIDGVKFIDLSKYPRIPD